MDTVLEVWAKPLLASDDAVRVRSFLVGQGVKARRIVPNFHITVYYARRPLPLIKEMNERAEVVLPAAETRIMLIAPGGQNPVSSEFPVQHMMGIRVQRKSSAAAIIQTYLQRMRILETSQILGGRKSSSLKTSAFGAFHFQPHMALVKPGGFGGDDLYDLGSAFRREIGTLRFNRFEVQFGTFNPSKAGWTKRTESLAIAENCHRCDRHLPIGTVVDIWVNAFTGSERMYSQCCNTAIYLLEQMD